MSSSETNGGSHPKNHNNNNETANNEEQQRQQHPYYILTPKAIQNLPNYKYNGVDRSLIYKFILSPLASFLVNNFTPSSLAPNTITLFGLVLMFASYLNMYYHCPTLEHCSVQNDTTIPNWIFLVNGIAILCYQTLDNMDGKQARKTNSSSPLGLLFDHGCDAINSIFGSVTWINALGLIILPEYMVQIWIMVFIPMFVFYVSTWEEYYTHKMDLPWINGPSEGLLIGASVNLITWWYGRSWWHGHDVFTFISTFLPPNVLDIITQACQQIGILHPIRNYDMIIFATILSAVREVTIKVKDIVQVYGIKTIKKLLPMVVLMVWPILIVHSDSYVFERNERWLFHLVALLFVEMVTTLMLNHTTGEEYKPFRKVLIPLFLLHYVVADGTLTYSAVDNYVKVYTTFMFIYMIGVSKVVISEICDLLNIWCFDIVTPRKKKVD